jgi:hypothetical protein
MSNLNLPISGFLVVRRVNLSTHLPPGLQRHASVPFSDDDIQVRYRGFEGYAWPSDIGLESINLNAGLASADQEDAVKAYYRTAKKMYQCDFVYLQLNTAMNAPIPPDFQLCGYDFGYYLSEHNKYSVLFNEIIYGQYDLLRIYARFLNQHLLLSSLDIIESIVRTRTQLLNAGADLETLEEDETLQPIAIHVPAHE